MSLPPPTPDQMVLITGASSGIGEALAMELGERGYNLVLVARREERLRELAAELQEGHGVIAEVRAADLSDDSGRQALIDGVAAGERSLAGLCNNAGFSTFGHFVRLDPAAESREVCVNVLALQELTAAFLPAMVARGSGAILNTGSIAGFQPLPCQATYGATKAFVNSFSEALHTELEGTGVSCTVLCPGPVRTEFWDGSQVGGIGPRALWASAADVAHAAIEGMIAGRRTVMPRLFDQLAATGGRHVPRSLMLPVWHRIASRGFGER